MINSADLFTHGVKLDDAYLTVSYDQLTVKFSVDRTTTYPSMINPIKVITEGNGVLGVPVLEMTVDCGGVINDDYTKVPGTPTDITLVRQAIPHFYPQVRDPQARKVLRAVYRRVVKL